MPVMSLETGRSPIREGFGCHVQELDSLLWVMWSYQRALSGPVATPAQRKNGGRQNEGLKVVHETERSNGWLELRAMKLMNQRDTSERELIDCQTMFGEGQGSAR